MRPLEEMTGPDKGKEGAEARVAGSIRDLIGTLFAVFFWAFFYFIGGSAVTNTIQNFLPWHLNSALALVAKRSNRALHQA